MDVNIIESEAVSPALMGAWSRLFDSVPDACYYHHPHWHQCIAEHLTPGALNLGLLTVEGQLQMVLPLSGSITDRHRAHPAHDHLSLNDVLIHPSLSNNADKLFNAVRLILDKPGTGWWDWKVTNLANNSGLIKALTTTSSNTTPADTSTVSSLSIREDKADHWLLKPTRQSANFNCVGDERAPTGKLRRNLRRLRKQLSENGELRVDTITDTHSLNDAYHHFLDVEASGWKGAGDQAPAISANAELRAFYQALLRPSVSGIEPQINLLWHNEKCVASHFGIRTGNVLSLLKIGYDEAFARYSPGYLLLESILDSAADRGINTLSLVTSPPWADRWHPDTVPVWQLNHYNNSTIGIVLHKFDGLKQVVKNRLKQAA